MAHIEIKARKYLDSGDARKIVKKGTIIAILTTGTISKPAKKIFDDAHIAWAENISEKQFLESEAEELE